MTVDPISNPGQFLEGSAGGEVQETPLLNTSDDNEAATK
jgi:hypothetical protein